MTLRRTMVSVLAFWLVAMLLPTGASAEFRLHISDNNGFSVIVTDDGGLNPGGGDLLPLPGAILHHLLIYPGGDETQAATEVTVTTAFSKNSGFTFSESEMYLSSFMLTTSAAVSLTLTLEDIDFDRGTAEDLILTNNMVGGTFCGGEAGTDPVSGEPTQLPTRCTADTSVMLTATSYANADNLQLFGGADPTVMIPSAGEGTTATASLPFPCSFPEDCTTPFAGTTSTEFTATAQLYALYTQIVVSFTGAGEVNFEQITSTTVNDQLVRVPEPASLLLIVTGVFGLACAKRRRSSTARVI